MLLAFSGLLLLIPVATPVHATQVAPTIKITQDQWYAADNWGDVNFNVTNPASNSFGITAVVVTAPNTWFIDGCDEYALPGDDGTFYFNGCGSNPAESAAWWNASSSVSGAPLPPGQTQDLEMASVWFPTGASYPLSGTFTTEIFDSAGGHYAGPSFTLYAWSPDTTGLELVTAQHGSTTPVSFIAGGSALTFGAHLDGATSAARHQAGLAIFFQSVDNTSPDCTSTNALDFLCPGSGVFSGTGVTQINPWLAMAMTNSTGGATVTFKPSNTVGSTQVTAYLGGGPTCDGYWTNGEDPLGGEFGCDWWYYSSTIEVDTAAAKPSSVAFLLSGDAFPSTHYVSDYNPPPNSACATCNVMAYIAGSTMAVSPADAFGNLIAFNDPGFAAPPSVTVTATSGGGVFDIVGNNATSITYADGYLDDSGNILVDYYQSGTYGTTGVLSAAISGTFNLHSVSLTGNSGSVVTSTFDTDASGAITCTDCGGVLAAGSKETVKYQLNTPQKGVPIIFFAVNNTSPYLGNWVGGNVWDATTMAYNITGTTSLSGKATEKFAIDTDAQTPAEVYFYMDVVAPSDANPGQVYDGSAFATAALDTTFGPMSGLAVFTYFDSGLSDPNATTGTLSAFDGTSLYVKVQLVDAYGNNADNDLGVQIGLQLTPSAGVLSTTAPYICAICTATSDPGGFGPILWTVKGTAPTTITLKASGSVAGSAVSYTETLNIVTKNPTLTAKSLVGKTISGIIYTDIAGVTFSGKAKVSPGYSVAAAVDFSDGTCAPAECGVWAKVDSGNWVDVTDGAAPLTWTYTATLTAGLHTVTFSANDSEGNNVATPISFQVLVDSSAPTIAYTTAANANISAGVAVTGTITDTLGDLNATSVTATGNSTHALTVSVTGTNNPGHSVPYSFSITGLTTGTWHIVLSAADLAGNAATKSITVHVTVPLAQSFVVSGTPSKGTLGSYTGINVAYQNLNPTSQSVVVFAVWKNSLGQTVGIGTSSATVSAGSTFSAFIVEPVGIASGSYTVNLFVVTTSNAPVSVSTSISVSV